MMNANGNGWKWLNAAAKLAYDKLIEPFAFLRGLWSLDTTTLAVAAIFLFCRFFFLLFFSHSPAYTAAVVVLSCRNK